MKTEEIDKLEAGRELDALVAEKVMGLIPCTDPIGRCEAAHKTPPQCWGNGGAGAELRGYSARIEEAWEVVDKLGPHYELKQFFKIGDTAWVAEFGAERIKAYAPSAPLAICRAALKAVTK